MPPLSLDAHIISTPTAAWESWLQNTPLISSHITCDALFSSTTDSLDKLLAHLSSSARARTGLILATTKGNIDAQIAYLRHRDSDPKFRSSPPILSAQAAHRAAHAQLGGPIYTISTACSSGITAIIDACFTLLDHDADYMVAVGLDLAGDFVRDGFTALKALAPNPPGCLPFDRDRAGLALGTASAACLLSRDLTPSARCSITGYGVASDAVHMTAPDRQARGLITAMQNALNSASLAPDQIDAILLHGTATRYNDAMEAVAIDAVFRQENKKGPALTAVKGVIGHSLGASALIETVLACRILETGIIPPVTGLRSPDRPDLDFVTIPRNVPAIEDIMKVASGFGGLNAAIILSRNTSAGVLHA